ncbi:hypothetical protein PRK78_000161 [Emydomyces testavorans]|uniref:Uncharacterized protein n=1 Tax=Emydomyces testavorans TaxID=2070801 RepID=A0AAF0DA59_9EURO|nr:hypothetical protein PRK78_000161 [Emydomyces testavorans]
MSDHRKSSIEEAAHLDLTSEIPGEVNKCELDEMAVCEGTQSQGLSNLTLTETAGGHILGRHLYCDGIYRLHSPMSNTLSSFSVLETDRFTLIFDPEVSGGA